MTGGSMQVALGRGSGRGGGWEVEESHRRKCAGSSGGEVQGVHS